MTKSCYACLFSTYSKQSFHHEIPIFPQTANHFAWNINCAMTKKVETLKENYIIIRFASQAIKTINADLNSMGNGNVIKSIQFNFNFHA